MSSISRDIPVLWIWGPPATGKTTVAWRIWSEVSTAGITAGYVDIDQVGMSVPRPADDPEHYQLKVDNLAAVVRNCQAAGARLVVISGTCDVERARGFADSAPVTLCRLALEHDQISARLAGRGWAPEHVQAAITEAVELDASTVAEVSLDTTGLTVTEVVDSLREQVGGWPLGEPADTAVAGASGTPGEILWLCGPTGVGKSTIGWEVFTRSWQNDRPVAFIDLQQVGFLAPRSGTDAGNHRLKADNLAAIWSAMHARGARNLVLVGAVEDGDQFHGYTEALPAATFTLVRLDASRDQLAERIACRGDGQGPQIPGDLLRGRDTTELARVTDQAAADTERLARAGIGDLVLDTDRLTPGQATDALLRRIGDWPPP
jgi:adenylylsulfate kinase-like enzyme